jgi:AcrR family transcriptional regulator
MLNHALGDTMPLPTHRQSRTVHTRAAIENAAIGLFAQSPIDAVTIDDIVGAAEVAKGTFYRHFKDKRALVEALAIAIRRDIEPVIAQANEGFADPAMRLARGIAVYIRFAFDQPDRALLLGQIDDSTLSASSELNKGLISDLEHGLKTGRFSFDGIDAAMVFVAGSARVIVLNTTRAASGVAGESRAQQMVAMVLRGLGMTGAEPNEIAELAVDAMVRRRKGAVT